MGALSVIVVSRHRPMALARCLTALRQQLDVTLEVIVVADPEAAEASRTDDLKVVAYDEANISKARNLGLSQAAADVVAFIDDDAVPEPTWAARLLLAFEDPETIAATGFVRGRNGISMQWRAMAVDAMGQDFPLNVPEHEITRPDPGPGLAVKTQGTNCAFRASVLRKIGGFDPNYRFFLDETDVNLRLNGLGQTAIVPLAQVHHGYLASDRRRSDRVPLSLYEIAASSAVFLRRHSAGREEEGRQKLWEGQTARLMAHKGAGRLDQPDVDRLLETLEEGWADGLSRLLSPLAALPQSGQAFLPLRATASGEGVFLCGWRWRGSRLKAQAEAEVKQGKIVTVVLFSFGIRRHWLGFTEGGYWLQSGGLWGRADRNVPVSLKLGLKRRCEALMSEFRRFRPVDKADV